MGGLGLVHSFHRAHRAVVPAIARLLYWYVAVYLVWIMYVSENN